jgi:hypothetical protein
VARDITEGRATQSIAIDIGVVSTTSTWQNTDIAYDVAIGGLPFIYAINDTRPYIRQTAPFKKDQFDNGSEPGEQSLTGWWIRSQSSFHSGMGIKFFDTQRSFQSVDARYTRYADSRNIDVWTEGQATLLKETANMSGVTTGIYKLISAQSGSNDVVIGYIPGTTTIKSFAADGTVITTYAPTGLGNILDGGVCTDGTRLFVADSDHIYQGPINAASAGWSEYYPTGSRATLAWVKQRLVAAVTNSIYELTAPAGIYAALPTPVYTHPNTEWKWTSISESGGAIYAAGYAGGNSAIYKFTLTSAGVMPTLTSGVVAAQFPIGEVVNKIEYYLGYLMIGTNKGVRASVVSETDGSINYGPLIIEDSNGVYDFAFRDRFVWLTSSIGGFAGLYRIDLSNEISTLDFAYATDAYLDGITGYATSVDFVGNSNQVAFTTSGSNGIAIQSTTVLAISGYLTTGNIRYGTLEPKNFKRLLGRGDFTYGSMTLETVDKNGVEYDHISYDANIAPIEVTTSNPATAQEYVAYKFIMYRDATVTTSGPIFKGYQAKATIATPRQRIVKFPVYCFDVETDRFNTVVGYQGRAFEKMQRLEDIETSGDVLTWQDLSTGESRQAVIEEITFTRMTPPDKRFDGFGGVLEITIRTV